MTTLYKFQFKSKNEDPKFADKVASHLTPLAIRYAFHEEGASKSLSVVTEGKDNRAELAMLMTTLQTLNISDLSESHEALVDEINVSVDKKTNVKKKPASNKSHWWKGGIGTIWGIAFLILALFGGHIPIIATYILSAASSLLTLILGYESYRAAFTKLFHAKKLTMDALFTISTLTIVAVSIASFFVPWLPVMFEAAPLIFGLRHLGKAIEKSLKTKVLSNLKMRDCAVKEVNLINSNHKHNPFPSSQLIPNDIITVAPGEVIPVDGMCLNSPSLYTTKITGSPFPKSFSPKTRILAGMKVAADSAPVRMRVTTSFQRSYLARVDDNLKTAHKEKAPIEHVTQKILQYFIPALLGAAILSGVLIGIFFTPALAIQCAIAVLVSACPCALGFITPLAVKIGMNKAAQQGINFKSGKSLQAARTIDTIVFDLNGTLTTGKPVVSHWKKHARDYTDEDCLKILSLLEANSDHPIAKAILQFSCEKGIAPPTKKISVDKSHHSGLKATIDGDEWIVGNEKMLALQGIHLHLTHKEEIGHLVYLVKNQELVATLTIHDPLRPEAIATINELKPFANIRVCSGADTRTVHYFAKKFGIPPEHAIGGCVGNDTDGKETSKASYIKELQDQGMKVAMVGDAGNDALAMAQADVGIAIQSDASDEITYHHAGAMIPSASLLPLVAGFEVAKQTGKNIIQNLVVSLTYNSAITLIAGGLLVAVGFSLNPAIGIALMVLETSLVLANTYRFKMQSLPHTQHATHARLTIPENAAPSSHSYFHRKEVLVSPTLQDQPNSKTKLISHFPNKKKNSTFFSPPQTAPILRSSVLKKAASFTSSP